jgi:hypothetical protein
MNFAFQNKSNKNQKANQKPKLTKKQEKKQHINLVFSIESM